MEFLVEDGEFYFMEVNTRIQVEHTVTEAVTGIDIVRWQLRVAAGEQLDFTQEDVSIDGHAVEYRINAENPAEDFAPTPGPLTTYAPPSSIGVRLDHAVSQGDEIGGDYDSMIAKLIVAGEDRDHCLDRSRRALDHFTVEGVHTTIPFHRLMLDDDTFRAGTHTTKYLDQELADDALDAAVARWGTDEVGGNTSSASTDEIAVEVDGKRFDVVVTDGLPRVSGDGNASGGSGSGASGGNSSGGGPVATSGAITAEMQALSSRPKSRPVTISQRAMSSACWRR